MCYRRVASLECGSDALHKHKQHNTFATPKTTPRPQYMPQDEKRMDFLMTRQDDGGMAQGAWSFSRVIVLPDQFIGRPGSFCWQVTLPTIVSLASTSLFASKNCFLSHFPSGSQVARAPSFGSLRGACSVTVPTNTRDCLLATSSNG
jgi:hypothetical protein